MFELSQLRSFVTVAAELHFGRAAARLNLSQPPLSRQIQALERELGVALLIRTSRSVQLTSAGRTFLGEARALLEQAEAAAQAARRAADAHSGTVVLGFFGSAVYDVLPRILLRARVELPGIALTVREMLTTAQLEALASRRIDLALIRPLPDQRQVDTIPVASEPLLLAVPVGHPLERRAPLRLADLHGVPFVMYSNDDGWYLHEILTTLFREAGVLPDHVQHVSQSRAALSLVSAGMGAALVPASTRNASFGNVHFRHLPLPDSAVVRTHAAWRRDNDNAALPPVRALLSHLDGAAPGSSGG